MNTPSNGAHYVNSGNIVNYFYVSAGKQTTPLPSEEKMIVMIWNYFMMDYIKNG